MTTKQLDELDDMSALELMRRYHVAQKLAADAERRQDALGTRLKTWLQAHGEPLEDAETGLVGAIRERQEADGYDVNNLLNEHVLALREIGALVVNAKAIAAVRDTKPALYDALRRFRMPGRVTHALDVRMKE